MSWYDHTILRDKEHQRRCDAFAAWTGQADSVCHLGTDAVIVEQKYYQVEAALRTSPVAAAPATGKIAPAEFEGTFYGGAYNFLWWPQLATVLSAHLTKNDTRPLQTAYNRCAAPGA